jgi:hypothetical protein
MEDNDISYYQPEMHWKTYSIVSSSNTPKTFSCAEMSEIVFNEMFAVPQRQQPLIGKIRHSPLVYRIDFHIKVTVCPLFLF